MKQYTPHYHKKFFVLAFISTWLCWLPIILFPENQNLKLTFMLAGLSCPFLTALWLIFNSKDKILKNIFFNKLLNLKLIKLNTIPIIIFIPVLSMILAIVISLFFGYSAEQFTFAQSFSFHIGRISTLLILFLAASLEELGWRGYGVESLNSKYNYFKATLIFGLLWSSWHLPLFWIPQTYQYDIMQLNTIFAINFVIGIVPLAFIISWICKKNQGSILTAIFFHFVINLTQELFVVDPATKCFQTIVLTILAILIVYLNKEMFFQNEH